MEVLLVALLGFAIGFIFACIGVLSLKVGTLRVDRSDPNEAPYLFLEIDKGAGDISSRKMVLLDVRNQNYVSQ